MLCDEILENLVMDIRLSDIPICYQCEAISVVTSVVKSMAKEDGQIDIQSLLSGGI